MRILLLIPLSILFFYLSWQGLKSEHGIDKAIHQNNNSTTLEHLNTSTLQHSSTLQPPTFICDRKSDSMELVKFYNATGGNNWWKKWDLNKPMNTWWGIRLNVSGCVESINLSDTLATHCCTGNNLVGTLLDINLPNLLSLLCHSNPGLSGNIPNFSGIPNIQSLQFSGCALKGDIPNFDKIPNLEILNLSNCFIGGRISNLDHLPKLRSIVLNSNGLSGNVPDFKSSPQIEIINLSSNNLSGNVPNYSQFSKLVSINISLNPVSGSLPDFANCPSMEAINFNNCLLKGTVPLQYINLINLKYLSFAANSISGILPNLSFNTKLESIIVNQNQLTGLLPNLSNLKALRVFLFDNNSFHGNIPDFGKLNQNISRLYFNNNNYTFSSVINSLKSNISRVGINKFESADSVSYYPQQKIFSDTTIRITPNTSYTLDLLIDDTVTTSTYTWYKNGALYKTIKGSNKLPFTPFTTNDAGTYTVKITNPLAPQLTLESWPIRLYALPMLVCDRRSDSLELVKFYNATGGANWWKKWDLSKPIDTWWGIEQTAEGCVSKILLYDTLVANGSCIGCSGSGNHLMGTLISLNLPNLIYLGLEHNQLSGFIPNFDMLPNLKVLSLDNNKLVGTIPNLNLPDLQTLLLSFNQLTGSIPNFDKLPNLQFLDISANLLSGSIPNFDKLPNVNTLWLFSNKLMGNIPLFDNLHHLKHLELYVNQLTGIIPNFDLPDLYNLQLNDNKLSGIIPNFDKLPNLTFVNLSNNKLTGTIPNFEKLPNLISLDLMKNQLSGIIPNFDMLANLKDLFLGNNELFGSIPNFDLPDLSGLQLNDNQLTGIIPIFDKLPNLTLLFLKNNQLTGAINNNAIFNPKLTLYNLDKNKITFTGLIKNLKIVKMLVDISNRLCSGCSFDFDTLTYAPQQKIYTDTTILITPNTSYTLDLLIDDTVTTSTYTWYKNGILDTIIKGKNKLPFTPFTTNDAGTYTVKITNPLAPQLTLESWPIRLNALPMLVCDRRSDSLELVKFYNATIGSNWTIKWDLSKPINTWNGIVLSSQGCVSQINLPQNNLSGTLIALQLPALEILLLSQNNIKGNIPDFFFPNLRNLSIGPNQLSGSIPNFKGMPLLQFIYLDDNQFSDTIPNFDQLPDLSYLDLHNNHLSGFIPDFKNLPKLSNLLLGINNLIGPIPDFNLPNMYNLYLDNNQLTGSIPQFDKLHNLNLLVLSTNQLTGPIPSFVGPNLSQIYIHHNQLSGTIPDFGNLPNLSNIDVRNNQLSGTIPDASKFNPKLIAYFLGENKFTFSGIIKNIKNLKSIIAKNQQNPLNDTLNYHPQQKIYADTAIFISPNSNYTLDLLIDDTVTTSTYTWYKNGILYKTIKGSNKLPITPFTSNDVGTYTVKITNPLAPQLTLESWPIRLNAMPMLVCDRIADSLELVKFYDSTGGANWTTKWDLSKPINMWWGVTLNSNGCVEILNLSKSAPCCDGNGVRNQMPDIYLPFLKVLSLHGNMLSGQLPNLNFPSAENITFQSNKLKGTLPDFDKMPNLIDLNLFDNSIGGNLPTLSNLKNLEHLTIWGNQLSGIIPELNMPKLKILDISGNIFNGTIPDFKKLPSLEELYVYNGFLTGPLPNFTSIPKLRALVLFNQKITGIIPDFTNLPDLESLNLHTNLFNGSIPNLEKCKKLIGIDLSYNNLSGIIPDFYKTHLMLADLAYEKNEFTFNSMIHNLKLNKDLVDIKNKICPTCTYDTLRYAPQQCIYSDTTILVPSASNFTLDLKIDDTVTTSTYTWSKNGVFYKTIKGINKLNFLTFTNNDAGTYTMKITNPLAPQLTLESCPIRLLDIISDCSNSPRVVRIQADACGALEKETEFFQFITGSGAYDLLNNVTSVNVDGALMRSAWSAPAQTLLDGLNAKYAPCASGNIFIDPYKSPYNGVIPPNNMVIAFTDINPMDDALKANLKSPINLCGKAKIFVIKSSVINSVAVFGNQSTCPFSCPKKINFTFGTCLRQYDFDPNKLDANTGAYLEIDNSGNTIYKISDGCYPAFLTCDSIKFIAPNLSPLTCSSVGHQLPIMSHMFTGNARYFTLPGRKGRSYPEGAILFDSITLYANDFNSCDSASTSIEKSYPVRIIASPKLDISMARNETACGYYILPKIIGANLSGNQKYWSDSIGVQLPNFNEGDTIRSNTALFAFDKSAGCSDFKKLSITFVQPPDIKNTGDTLVSCGKTFALPLITGKNLFSAGYHTAPNKGGSAPAFGTLITKSSTIYLYDSIGHCIDQDSFKVILAPNIFLPKDTFRNDTFCNSFKLPASAPGVKLKYHDDLFNTYAPGDMITSTTRLYYDASIPGCTLPTDTMVLTQRKLIINPITIPRQCTPIDTLPLITGINLTGNVAFYVDSVGKGKKYLPNDTVHAIKPNFFFSDKILYAYDEAKYHYEKCPSNSLKITIPFFAVVDADPIGDVSLNCGQSFTTPQITPSIFANQFVYSAPNKQGTRYKPGDLITKSGTYYSVSERLTCFDEDTFKVSFNNTPKITLTSDKQIVKYQTSQIFDLLTNDNIPASLSVNINIDNGQNGDVKYSQASGKGVYTPRKGFSGKEVLNYKVCPVSCPDACSTSTIEFDVEPPCNDKTNLVLPNVIFPEGASGDNRYFIVEALNKCPEAFGPKPTKFMVYNRWGDQVFHSNDYKNDWDGNNDQGQPLPAGTYYYLLDLGGVSAPVKGYVVIMR
jgi:Leucine-rich repeat (LRR) protein